MHYPFQIRSEEAYHRCYQRSIEQPNEFWLEIAQSFSWIKPPTKALGEWDFINPHVNWFEDAELNITINALDRHAAVKPNTPALIWEPNDPEQAHRILTYSELLMEVCRFTQVLRQRGVNKGDRICIYMSMIPELAIAVLACARIGAIHSVVFGGFSAQSISDRIQDAGADYVITQNAGMRGNKEILLKQIMDEALDLCTPIKQVFVFQHTTHSVAMKEGRDVWCHKEMQALEHFSMEAEVMKAEDPLFILYTSGSTGKPKGVVHSSAGYMVYTTYTFVNVFQYQPQQVFFCTADIGWITGHSYLLYGALCAGATTLMFEGLPTWPDAGRFWDIIDKFQVDILYTAPTAIRSLMALGDEYLEGKNLSSLRVLGTVGEPINEEAWQWYHDKIGKSRCSVVDTWWQTETGGIMMSNLAGVTPQKATYATWPLPGIQPILIDESGKKMEGSSAADPYYPNSILKGNLCIQFPWPSMIRTTYGDHDRCRLNYFSTYPGYYFTGDGCFRDENGFYRITGRVDDVVNVSGHRIGTAEVENAINFHTGVVESAVVGYPHDRKGQGIYAFVILGHEAHQDAMANRRDILDSVTTQIGAFAKPDKIQFVSGLPKTRSGKIMRRILRKIAEGEIHSVGDTTTLLDPAVVQQIIEGRIA